MALVKCPECGKEISDKASFCPVCGYRSDSFVTSDSNARRNVGSNDSSGKILSTIGFVLGIVSWFLNFLGLVGIAATVIGFVALSKEGCNKTYAWIGIVSGICNILYACVLVASAL